MPSHDRHDRFTELAESAEGHGKNAPDLKTEKFESVVLVLIALFALIMSSAAFLHVIEQSVVTQQNRDGLQASAYAAGFSTQGYTEYLAETEILREARGEASIASDLRGQGDYLNASFHEGRTRSLIEGTAVWKSGRLRESTVIDASTHFRDEVGNYSWESIDMEVGNWRPAGWIISDQAYGASEANFDLADKASENSDRCVLSIVLLSAASFIGIAIVKGRRGRVRRALFGVMVALALLGSMNLAVVASEVLTPLLEIDRCTITPGPVTLNVGEVQAYVAHAWNGSVELESPFSTTWSLSGSDMDGRVGILYPGSFRAMRAGTGQIWLQMSQFNYRNLQNTVFCDTQVMVVD